MKLNWGHKLVVSMTLFIAFVVFLGIRMWGNQDSIEEDDYYSRGQRYEEQIVKERNTNELKEQPQLVWNPNGTFSITMPDKTQVSKANLLLYKPDASNQDKTVDVSALKATPSVMTELQLEKGKWIAKFEWSPGNKDYYLEKVFFVENQ
jgi:hypothetical protein